MRPLPDPDLSLRDASDFIFESLLCRRALLKPDPAYLAVFVRDLIGAIYRLTVSCHLAEFTDHGLQHLCSLVDRLSRWTSHQDTMVSPPVVEQLDPSECAVLLLGTLFHDVGMLSQRPEDMPPDQPQWQSKAAEDIPDWVRSTHIKRLEGLVGRLFAGTSHVDALTHSIVRRAFLVARAHGSWPSEWHRFGFGGRDAGLAAMLAVADLLDEDNHRCDTETLLRHRFGTQLNCAHWIRHGLTGDRVLVQEGVVSVVLHRPPDTDAQLAPVYSALRNHYRLCLLYLRELEQAGAGIIRIIFSPENGCPQAVAPELRGWSRLAGFGIQQSFLYHLTNSFMPEAILDSRRTSTTLATQLRTLGLEEIDLTEFYRVRGGLELHSSDEQAFEAILS